MEDTKEIIIEAKLENVAKAIDFLDEELIAHGCRVDVMQRIDLALEEMLVNISNYSYQGEVGKASVTISFPEETQVQLDIRDWGTPYDPTKKPDPDVTIPLKLRKKGGLGIYMTKMVMDTMEYEYAEGTNHIILTKDFKQADQSKLED